ncbi:50S ribosomal protein L25/general stress protein Ctc [Peribacillus muralis]|uniref:50S ribosomal protein L25/general stress protein Ctc n=1 Tax=Peribacillus muralis TaxID=264697 RepID=UPI001F4D6C7A|nr:50S ribosomal protein L25/general stress protein Ctc [Peribacillus muralis]MCK1995412.1 50S ribosomal protein L25/general stress protein Ctc [Peribacillus muralis]MCK2015995.1 50S ribosomal protein L25/general stress protein Ctc [Peribacillus muralis]
MSNLLAAKERTDLKHSNLRNLRESGEIPAVVYGNQNGSTAISVNNIELQKTIKEIGRNGIISLDLDGKSYKVMLSDYQKDPIKNFIFHADFLIVDMSAQLQAQVRINLVGTSKGVKDGGVLQQSLHEVTITAKPNDIPDAIDVDVTELQVGDTIYISDIQSNQQVTIDNNDEEVVASVLAPRQEEEISTGEQQDGGIPENEEGRETKPSSES